MAGIGRLRVVQKLMLSRLLAPVNRSGLLQQPRAQPTISNLYSRAIGTTRVKRDEVDQCKPVKPKPWVSLGYSETDQQLDKESAFIAYFISISVVLTFGSWILMYLPDFRLKDWAHREAYLELRRRESLGLPPIDSNLIDPARIKLPTDEELGDTEIII